MKKSYTAYFYTDAEYASTEIDADTPGLALAAACRMKDEDGGATYRAEFFTAAEKGDGDLLLHIDNIATEDGR